MEKPKIKCLVLDIDGTLVGRSENISQTVKQAIGAAQKRGVYIAIATSRDYGSTLPIWKEIRSNQPLTCYGGALIKHPKTQQIYRHFCVSKSLARQLLEDFDRFNLPEQKFSPQFHVNEKIYVRTATRELQDYAKRFGIEVAADVDLRQVLTKAEPTCILGFSQDATLIDKQVKNLRKRYSLAELSLNRSGSYFFECLHPSADKGRAVHYLTQKILGLRVENVMAVGDYFNDLSMLKYVGVGVAMGNAPQEVKAQADWVAPSVEQDGVAAAIEKFILQSSLNCDKHKRKWRKLRSPAFTGAKTVRVTS